MKTLLSRTGAACVVVFISALSPAVRAALIPGTSVAPALWLEANVGVTTSGSSVTAWADQSGNGRNASVPGGSTAPTLVAGVQTGASAFAPVVRFDGVSNALTGLTSGLTLNGMEAFIVARLASSTAANSGVTSFATASPDYLANGAIAWSAGFSGGAPTGGDTYYNGSIAAGAQNFTLPLNNFYVYEMTITNGAGSITDNVSAENTVSLTTTSPVVNVTGGAFTSINPTYYAVGARALGGGTVGFSAAVDIAAVILYNAPLSSADRSGVQSYLTAEYVNAPEPTTLSLLSLGITAIAMRRRHRRA